MFKRNQICEEYGLKILKQKIKTMAFIGKEFVTTKIIIDKKVLEQVSHFNYLVSMQHITTAMITMTTK